MPHLCIIAKNTRQEFSGANQRSPILFNLPPKRLFLLRAQLTQQADGAEESASFSGSLITGHVVLCGVSRRGGIAP